LDFEQLFNLSLKSRKNSLDKGFIKILSSWRWAGIYVREKNFCWTTSRMKCRSSSKYFILKCIIGFTAIRTTSRLSGKIVGIMEETCNSWRRLMIHLISAKAITILWYSDSLLLYETTFFFAWCLGNQIGAKEDNKPCSWFVIIRIRSPICISKSLKIKLWTTRKHKP